MAEVNVFQVMTLISNISAKTKHLPKRAHRTLSIRQKISLGKSHFIETSTYAQPALCNQSGLEYCHRRYIFNELTICYLLPVDFELVDSFFQFDQKDQSVI